MKQTKIIFWTATVIIFLFETVMPALTFNTELAKSGISHLGFPAYFGSMLIIFKILGGLTLIIPSIPARVKEWAYAGFAFNFISASVAHAAVDGFNFQTFFPLIIFGILIASYISWHKLNQPALSIA
jgi:hypothetical protein